MQGAAGIREICTQPWEIYTSTGHGAARRARGLCCSLTFYRPTRSSRARLSASGTFGPSLPCPFLCPGHLEECDNASLCPAAGSAQPAPQKPLCPTAVPVNPTAIHLHAGGLRLLELAGLAPPCRALGACSSWNYIASCVIESIPHFTP